MINVETWRKVTLALSRSIRLMRDWFLNNLAETQINQKPIQTLGATEVPSGKEAGSPANTRQEEKFLLMLAEAKERKSGMVLYKSPNYWFQFIKPLELQLLNSQDKLFTDFEEKHLFNFVVILKLCINRWQTDDIIPLGNIYQMVVQLSHERLIGNLRMGVSG